MTDTSALRASVVPAVLSWYDANARDLPWRRPGAGPWAVLVSEIMLQQTPVTRVVPAYHAWLGRWPTPAALAADAPGEAVRQWGRLGYPKRALRLHEAATVIASRYAGTVPASYDDLRSLPGVGDYTAAAVATFGYGRRHAVLDTNVRRVLARVVRGAAHATPGRTAAERRTAHALLPDEPATAARWAVASMELGALVCRARSPRCGACPISAWCRWRLAGGRPEPGSQRRAGWGSQPDAAPRGSQPGASRRESQPGAARRGQRYAGTDRQARGRLLAVVRDAEGPVPATALEEAWHEPLQRARALHGLVADALVEPLADGTYRLPGVPLA